MRRTTLACLLVLTSPALAATATATAPNPDKAAHTVSWYREHQQAMRQMRDICTDDRTYENYPDCKNAAAASDSMVRGPYGQGITGMDDPATYANDPLQRKIVLGMCRTSTPPPAAMCRAAAAAGGTATGERR